MRWLPVPVAAALLALALAGWPAFALAARIALVLGSAPAIGGVLLSAVARLTGARWQAAAETRAMPALALAAALAMLAPTGVAVPPHLAIWLYPVFIAVRAATAMAALAWAGGRLHNGADATFAGVTLALYAALITPLAADWLLPLAPGHPVSAAGMMLFLIQFAAGCAAALGSAAPRARRDLALLLVAALLGLCYLAYMDYLIVWYGNLPARVPFYQARPGWIAGAALAVGLIATVALVTAGRERDARWSAAAGLALFCIWWMGAGASAALAGTAAALAIVWPWRGGVHHG